MARRGERLVIPLKVTIYTPISTTRRRSWVRVPHPPTLYAHVNEPCNVLGQCPLRLAMKTTCTGCWLRTSCPCYTRAKSLPRQTDMLIRHRRRCRCLRRFCHRTTTSASVSLHRRPRCLAVALAACRCTRPESTST
jgi:hypothetical protein